MNSFAVLDADGSLLAQWSLASCTLLNVYWQSATSFENSRGIQCLKTLGAVEQWLAILNIIIWARLKLYFGYNKTVSRMQSTLIDQVDKQRRNEIKTAMKVEKIERGQVQEICYSAIEKENKSGIMFNDRVLILLIPESVGYVNSIDSKTKLPFGNNLPNMKHTIKLSNVKDCKQAGKNFTLTYVEEGKTDQKKWVLKANNEDLAKNWVEKINSSKIVPKSVLKESKLKDASKIDQVSAGKALLPEPEPEIALPQPSSNRNPLVKEYQSIRNIPEQPEPMQSPKISPIRKLTNEPLSPTSQRKKIEQILEMQLEKEKLKQQQKQPRLSQKDLADANSNWNYRYYKSKESKQQILMSFEDQCLKIVKIIVDGLCLPEKQRKHRPSERQRNKCSYQVQGIKFTLAFSSLEERIEKYPVYDQTALHEMTREFNNLKYIFSHCGSRHKCMVPLTCLIQYKGILVMAKSMLLECGEQIDIQNEQVIKQLKELSIFTKIDASIYESTDITKIDYTPFFISEDIEKPGEDYSVYYIEQVSDYLPLQLPKFSIPELFIRPQILQRSEFSQKLFKGQPQVRVHKDIKLIQTASSRIEDIAAELVNRFEWRETNQTTNLIATNSFQFEYLLQRHGLQVYHIPILYGKCKTSISKSLCASEIATLVCQTLLFNNIQEGILQGNDHTDDFFKQMIVDLLNNIFGHSPESELMWTIIQRQALYAFKIDLQRRQVNTHYLAISLAQGCGLIISAIDWESLEKSHFTNPTGNIFQSSQIKRFQSILVDHFETNFDREIDRLILEKNIDKISNLLEFNSKTPIKLRSFQQRRIYKLLTEFINPLSQQTPQIYIPFTFDLLYPDHKPTDSLAVQTFLQKLRWTIQTKNHQLLINQIQKVLTILSYCFGDYHPFYSFFYKTLIDGYTKTGQLDNAITMAKLEVVNCNHLYTLNHYMTSQSFIQLARLEKKFGDITSAINQYRKVISIFHNISEETMNYKEAESFANIEFAELLSSQNTFNLQFEQCCLTAANYYENLIKPTQNSSENLSLIYKNLISYYMSLKQIEKIRHTIMKIASLLPKISDPILFQQNYKIALAEELANLDSAKKFILKVLAEELSKQKGGLSPIETFTQGFKILKKTLNNGKFPLQKTRNLLQVCQSLSRQITQNNVAQYARELHHTEFEYASSDGSLQLAMVVKGWVRLYGLEQINELLSS